MPDLTTYTTTPPPAVSLTIQAALPGTLLADGETIPSPGQSVIVKLYNDNTPNDVGAANLATNFGSTGIPGRSKRRSRVRRRRRRRRRSPRPQPAGRSWCLLRAAHPGNSRQPDDRPAARSGDHHVTARRHGRHHGPRRRHGQYLEQRPRQSMLHRGRPRRFTSTTPAAGDGGYIYIGAESLNEYDPTNPLEGSLIDNADISYMSRIEIQGAGSLIPSTPLRPRQVLPPSRIPIGTIP